MFLHERPSSDILFSILMYITLFANVDGFLANLRFIQRNSDHSVLLGKGGYILTTFEAIYQTICNINGHYLLEGKIKLNQKRAF